VHTIERLSSASLERLAGELGDVLVDAVGSGASVGFLAPLRPVEATLWWERLVPAVAEGTVSVWAAQVDGRVVGTVQLRGERTANGAHRAEVAKLIVDRVARGRGLGRDLLAVAEEAAAQAGVTLLLLDTQTGSVAERLYRKAGWTEVGVVPDYAADPAGHLRPTTFFFKALS
jgi:GNAT superfamily N-acetyltransferase